MNWKVNLIDINSNSFFNIFLQNNENEFEDFSIILNTFHRFNENVMKYFNNFN